MESSFQLITTKEAFGRRWETAKGQAASYCPEDESHSRIMAGLEILVLA